MTGRKRQRVTITDVARLAGVATMTASRALNRPEMVSDELRQRVLQSADELNYIPDRAAGGLASGVGLALPVLVPTLHHSVYVQILEGLQERLPQAGYQLMLGSTEYSREKEETLVEVFLGWRPSAIVLSGIDHSERTVRLLRASGVPVVEIMDLADGNDTAQPLDLNIGFSHSRVGEAVVTYLAACGYRNIAYAGTLTTLDPRSVRRIQGFQGALKRLGLPHHLIGRSDLPSSLAVGRDLLAGLLEEFPQTDAVFFANDELAAGALFECQRRGLRVPDDLAIMGFSDEEIASHLYPALTTVRIPRHEIGRLAADLLLARLGGPPDSQPPVAPSPIDVGFEIVQRQTTRSPGQHPQETT
ncbi:LacI family DNA-binding transcriptional regulator (plasmid) [Deinococcus sp. KNUC1210]|uniref:LacI family DNA-binding transcriptional regulator n=1 Tax=Deinococcus sp. KNUC1210 TaxID=2917691 RepID=UPI001EF0649F|nr:LacI family DNA-binding transcriptional regulator [Deinococcus sp. KNUC1210]ULH14231.1 LacI family DNA-binding transcriptional regulator [Deinococcus sp. KNUC1210]